jgi:homoserine O-acetyltransferase/O-succinyltransferase
VTDTDYEVYNLGDVTLQHGLLPSARIAFKTHGKLNAARDNAIVFPTWYSGQHADVEWIIGEDFSLDPRRYFIIVVNIFGNGISSSPSNHPPPYDRTRFPRVTILDNVRMQQRLLLERYQIDRLRLVVGRSMGAQIAFQWSCYYPDSVENMLALAGSARTSPHNYIFLQTVKMALTSDPRWCNGEYDAPPVEGLNRMRLIFDSWGLSQTFYREGLHLKLGFQSTDAFLQREVPSLQRDANDYLAQIHTWEYADISDNEIFNGDLQAALGAIKARCIVMPSRTDLYFPPEDSEIEVAAMPNAKLRVMPSIWGHRAGSPGTDPTDIRFLDRAIGDLLTGL